MRVYNYGGIKMEKTITVKGVGRVVAKPARHLPMQEEKPKFSVSLPE